MGDDRETMTTDEVLNHIMRVTGKTRRQAKVALLEKLRSGELPARALNPHTGEVETIPPDVWPAIH